MTAEQSVGNSNDGSSPASLPDANAPQNTVLSWDSASAAAPARPTFASRIPEDELIDRPKRVHAVVGLVILSAICFFIVTWLAWLRMNEIQAAFIVELPSDLTSDYSTAQLRKAITALLALFGGLGLVLTIFHLLCIWRLRKRSAASRAWLLCFVALSLPVAFISLAVSEGALFDVLLRVAAAAALIIGVVLSFTPQTTRWLRQSGDPVTASDH